jgi:hypothetical protein
MRRVFWSMVPWLALAVGCVLEPWIRAYPPGIRLACFGVMVFFVIYPLSRLLRLRSSPPEN